MTGVAAQTVPAAPPPMDIAAPDDAQPPAPSRETRSPRMRRAGTWAVIAVVLVGVGMIGAALSGIGAWSQRDRLDPESAGPDGGRALARILETHGVHVEVVRSRAAARAALASEPATLVLPDSPYLSDAALTGLARTATDVVVMQPRSRGVRLLVPGARIDGYGDGRAVAPRCGLAAARRAGPIAPDTLFRAAPGTTACYPQDGAAALLSTTDGARRVTLVDGTELFTNARLAERGNAALAVNLLGRLPDVVWFVPTAADSDLPADVTIGSLTPPWVSPVIVVLIAAAVAAGIWRGRRFGPLVAERLPVTVRASETTAGRARLYARSRDAAHAIDQVRIGALSRIARLLGLGSTASALEIADAAAARTGWARAEAHQVLIDAVPTSDRELVALSDRLHDLEAAVTTAVRGERNLP